MNENHDYMDHQIKHLDLKMSPNYTLILTPIAVPTASCETFKMSIYYSLTPFFQMCVQCNKSKPEQVRANIVYSKVKPSG